MNITLLRALVVGTLAEMLALWLALAMGGVPAAAQDSVVGPGESIQKAVNAAHTGDTIVVRGVHREDVIIRKNGIKLRGEDAVIEAPDRADSKCSRAFGPEAICVMGDFDLDTGKVYRRVSDVSVSGFTIRGFKQKANEGFEVAMIEVNAARNTTVVGNDVVGGNAGIGIESALSINDTIERNNITGSKGGGVQVDTSRNTKIVNNVVRNIPEGNQSAIIVEGATATTVADNDLENNWVGTFVGDSPGTKILSNVVSRSGIVGAFLTGQKSADAKLVGNHVSGGPWGIYVQDAHGGSVLGNKVHDNCAGMFFEAFKNQPVGGFAISGNRVSDNTRSCGGQKFGRKFSGIGIALLGASGMRLTANHFWGNVPSGPTPISGGVVVSKDPYFQGTSFGGTQKPKDNTVIANHFGRNKPDIYWDKSGTGNRFVGNLCDTSVPSSLCN
jgi:parallel beta-helix repeat protein